MPATAPAPAPAPAGSGPIPFNACAYLVDGRLAAGDGQRTAVVCEGTETSYAQLRDLTAAVAAGLRALGMRPGERLLLCAADRTELLAAILGAWRADVVAVPVSTMFTGAELGGVLADSGARVVMASPETAAVMAEALGHAPQVSDVVGQAGATLAVPTGVRHWPWTEFLAAGGWSPGDPAPVAPTWEDSPALWLYTSGTTGLPKAAMHRQANIAHVVQTYGRQVLGIDRADRCLSVAKLFFAYGLGNSALFPLAVGASTVLEPRRPSCEVIEERLRADRPTLFFGVPTFFASMLAGQLPVEAMSSVRLCTSAGEALPAALQARFTQRYGVDILDGLGSTEALHVFVSNAPGEVAPGTSGRPVPGYEISLRDATGAEVAEGTPGSMFVRGQSIATGYWCRTEATRAVFHGPWLATGDTYVRDSAGRYTCLGRSNDLIKAGGIWVSPAEVEDRLLAHPGVAEAAVVGVADADGLDKPVAYVVRTPAAAVSAEELVAHCRQGLAAFKRPRNVVFVEALPRTATGKLQRFLVREAARLAGPVRS